jgi:ATP-dependent Clp endopeptidase proteolytic subunit ClpP
MSKHWYSFKAAAAGVEIFIYDEIGAYGITAKDFCAELAKHRGKAILLRIHSPGGSIFDGTAIYNALRSNGGKITSQVDGLAASMATFVALAGETVRMAENAMWMIHNPTGGVLGGSKDMRETADLLDKLRGSLVAAYCAKTGKTEKEVIELMDAETWMTAAEALEHGFIDEITLPLKAAAMFDLSRFSHPPAAYAHRLKGRALIDYYNALPSRERGEFLNLHEEALFEAARIVDAPEKSPVPPAEALSAARELWTRYNALSGAERSAFLRDHDEELTAAANILDRTN